MDTVNRLSAGITWEKPADLSWKDVLKRLSPSGVKAFLKIRELWGLRDEDARQLLGGISNAGRQIVHRVQLLAVAIVAEDHARDHWKHSILDAIKRSCLDPGCLSLFLGPELTSRASSSRRVEP